MSDHFLINLKFIFLDGNSLPGIVFLFIWGCFWGSFLNVCIYRLPFGRSIVYPGSSCPNCGQPVEWWQNIPILSFIIIRAKCYFCYSEISLRYPSIELTTGLVCAFLFYFFHGVTKEFFYFFIFSNFLIVIFFIDLDHWLILDNVTLPGITIGLIGSLFVARVATIDISSWWVFKYLPGKSYLLWSSFFDSIAGMLMGYVLFSFIALTGSLLLRQEAMGGGDIKFAGLIGAFLGSQVCIVAFVLSFFIGFLYALPLLVIRKKKGRDPVPFGTFMALAAFIAMLWGDRLLWWLLNWHYLLYT